MPPQGDLVTTGHLEPVKNHRYLLDVLAAANRAGQPLTLDVFGEGPLLPELTRLDRRHALLGDEVLATYIGTRPDGSRFQNTEIFGFDGDRIARTEVYSGWDLG